MAEYTDGGSDNLAMSDEAVAYRIISKTVVSNLFLGHNRDRSAIFGREANNTFNVGQDGVMFRALGHTVTFSQSVSIIPHASNSFVISQSASAFVTKDIEHTFTITDSAIRQSMTRLRPAQHSLSLSDIASAFLVRENAHGDCDSGSACTRDHVTFEYGMLSVDLRNPSEDSIQVVLSTINAYSRGVELYMNGSQPRFLQLLYTFTGIPSSQKNAFIAFLKQSAGMEITLTDFCNQQWLGCILDREINFEREGGRLELGILCPETDDGLYTWSLIFEGERI
jgi:hypothetical protein